MTREQQLYRRAMQLNGGELQGKSPSIAPKVALHGVLKGQSSQQQDRCQQAKNSALQGGYNNKNNAAAHGDFHDQISALPWTDVRPNTQLHWDPDATTSAAGAEGPQCAAASYDESMLLASRLLRQYQMKGRGRGEGVKLESAVRHDQASRDKRALLSGMERSAAAGEMSSFPLPPLSLGSGDFAGTRLLQAGDALYDGVGQSSERAAPAAGATPRRNFHHAQGAGQAAAAGGGVAPPRQRLRARRGQATDPHSIAERTDKASMLDEIIEYVKFLRVQVKVLSMSRLGGAAAVVPLAANSSSEANAGHGSAAGTDGATATEGQVAKLMMEEDIGSAMQYLQGKGLCLMPLSLASVITAAHPRGARGGSPERQPDGAPSAYLADHVRADRPWRTPGMPRP